MKKMAASKIILERQGLDGQVKVAHMCSNCYVHRVNLTKLMKVIEMGMGDWEVEVVDARTVKLRAPQGITFIKDVQIPIEEIMLAILETKVLRTRTKRVMKKKNK